MTLSHVYLTHEDFDELKKAKHLLEKDSIAIKLANFFGYLSEKIGKFISSERRERIAQYNMMIIEKSLELTMTTMDNPESEQKHIFYVTLSGAIGGIGILTLFLELPVTTVLMLRAIADIAKEEGEDYYQTETQIAVLQVFALGGEAINIETCETGYYAIRSSLDKPLKVSSVDIAKKGAAGIGTPFAVQLIGKIGAKYQNVISIQATSRTIPIIGAVAGAIINIIFLDLFQDKARGHFIVRRLEKKYSSDTIRQSYNAIHLTKQNKKSRSKTHAEKKFQEEIDRIIRHHVWGSMGCGMIPLPFVDLTGITIIQINMLKKLAKKYNVLFSKNAAKSVISSMTVNVISVSATPTIAMSFIKFIPVVGQTTAVLTMPIISGSITYAFGKVFARHFASGGTFLNFDPKKEMAYFQEMIKEGNLSGTGSDQP